MKALIAPGNGTLSVRDVAMPVTGDYDCLVKVSSCLFCNSTDRHIVDNTFDFGIPYPCIPGHESLGQVVSVGDKVTTFAPGDWVIRPYAIYPDEVKDNIGSGWGGFAEFGKIRDFKAMVDDGTVKDEDVPGFFRYMQKLPIGLDPQQCMMISCLREIYSSTEQIVPIKGQSFLVAGAGVAGCLFATFLKMLGAAYVAVTARRKEQLLFAEAHTGADKTVMLDDVYSCGREFDALVDTTGHMETAEGLYTRLVKSDGFFYSYAVYAEMSRQDFFEGLRKRMNFRRIDPVEASAHDEICAMLRDGRMDAAPYITHSLSIDQAQQAWKTVTDKKTLKTAIVF